MNPQIPPTDDDALSPDERELAQLYGRLSPAEPDAKLDAAVLAQARAAVEGAPGRARRRWSVGFASAAALVLGAGIAWRSDMFPAPDSAVVATTSSSAATHLRAPVVTPVTPAAQSDLRYAPAKPAARMSASTEAAAPPPPPKIVERVLPPPALVVSAQRSPPPAPAPASPPPPPAPPAPPAPRAELTPSPQMLEQAPSSASSALGHPDGTPAQRITYIRHLLREDHRTQAADAVRKLRKDYPDYPIPDDLRKLDSR